MILDMDKNYFYVVEGEVYQQVCGKRLGKYKINAFCVVILDAPIGMNSDIWLPLQESLKKKTTVDKS